MDFTYKMVRTQIEGYPPEYCVQTVITVHKLMTLQPTVQRFADRVELKLNMGGGMTVSLFPNLLQLYQELAIHDKHLIVVKFDRLTNDTVVFRTTLENVDECRGISFQRVSNSYRMYIAVAGQYIMPLVDREAFLEALMDLGGE